MTDFVFTDSFTRPSDTTAYTAGDLIANSTTAGSVTPLSFNVFEPGFILKRAKINITAATVNTKTNATYRLHLYSASPTVTNGDNGAWLAPGTYYMGYIDVDCSLTDYSDGVTGITIVSSTTQLPVNLGTSRIYGLLMANGAFTPLSATVFTVSLYGTVSA